MDRFNKPNPAAPATEQPAQAALKSSLEEGSFYQEPSNARYYEEILSTLPDWVWEVDSRGYITYTNPAVETLLGYSPDELVGKPFLSLVPQDQMAEARLMLLKQWGSSSDADYSVQSFVSNDGRLVALESSGNCFYHNYNRTQGVRFVSRKVSSQRRLQATGNVRDNFIAENLVEAIAMMDTNLKIIYVNKSFTKLFGYTRDEIIGLSMKVLGLDRQPESPVQPNDVVSALQHERFWQGEVLRRNKLGQYIPCMLCARAVYDEHNNISGYIGTYLDMRQMKQSDKLMKKALKATINAICNAIENRNLLKTEHQERVTDLAVAIAFEMGKDMNFIEGLTLACHLHDLGEMFIPPEITSMEGKLSESNYDMVKTHPKMGYEILKDLHLPWPVADIVLQHHERLDGSGYPKGLKGDEIMLEARIVAVADVVETMLTQRPYRAARSLEQCIDELTLNKGVLYDPQVVDICVHLLRENNYLLKRV